MHYKYCKNNKYIKLCKFIRFKFWK